MVTFNLQYTVNIHSKHLSFCSYWFFSFNIQCHLVKKQLPRYLKFKKKKCLDATLKDTRQPLGSVRGGQSEVIVTCFDMVFPLTISLDIWRFVREYLNNVKQQKTCKAFQKRMGTLVTKRQFTCPGFSIYNGHLNSVYQALTSLIPNLSPFFFFFGHTGVWTQNVVLARQMC
jgi:hypothetical protein